MSGKYGTVKFNYKTGLWTLNQVKKAVVKKWITSAEYKEITGFDYE